MPKTRIEVVEAALRRLGVLASDEAITADEIEYSGQTLDALFAELQTSQGLTITWTIETVPDAAFLGLANLLAAEVAPHYARPSPTTRARGWMRLREALLADNRADRRDLDEDGIVTAEEASADARAAYY